MSANKITVHNIEAPAPGFRATGVSFALDTNELTIVWRKGSDAEEGDKTVSAELAEALFAGLNQMLDHLEPEAPLRRLALGLIALLQTNRSDNAVEHLSKPVNRVLTSLAQGKAGFTERAHAPVAKPPPPRPAHVEDVDAQRGMPPTPPGPVDPSAPFDVDAAMGRAPIPDFGGDGVHDVDAALGRKPAPPEVPAATVAPLGNSEVVQAKVAAKQDAARVRCQCPTPAPVDVPDDRPLVPCQNCSNWTPNPKAQKSPSPEASAEGSN